MIALAWLIPVALFLGLLGLAAFLWALRNGQFDDLEGASWRAIQNDSDVPMTAPAKPAAEPDDTSPK